MINGTLKYLMIALSAVFLWGSAYAISPQEIEKTILPMKSVTLHFKKDQYLLTRHQAEQLDKVLMHMRSKPEMRINIEYFWNEELKAKRLRNAKAYLVDNGLNKSRIHEDMVTISICEINCFGDILISQVLE